MAREGIESDEEEEGDEDAPDFDEVGGAVCREPVFIESRLSTAVYFM